MKLYIFVRMTQLVDEAVRGMQDGGARDGVEGALHIYGRDAAYTRVL
jgi:hypothetical protein